MRKDPATCSDKLCHTSPVSHMRVHVHTCASVMQQSLGRVNDGSVYKDLIAAQPAASQQPGVSACFPETLPFYIPQPLFCCPPPSLPSSLAANSFLASLQIYLFVPPFPTSPLHPQPSFFFFTGSDFPGNSAATTDIFAGIRTLTHTMVPCVVHRNVGAWM